MFIRVQNCTVGPVRLVYFFPAQNYEIFSLYIVTDLSQLTAAGLTLGTNTTKHEWKFPQHPFDTSMCCCLGRDIHTCGAVRHFSISSFVLRVTMSQGLVLAPP